MRLIARCVEISPAAKLNTWQLEVNDRKINPPERWWNSPSRPQELLRGERELMRSPEEKREIWKAEQVQHGTLCVESHFPPDGPVPSDLRYRLPFKTYLAPHHQASLRTGEHKLPVLVHLHGGGFLIGTSGFQHCASPGRRRR